MVIIKQLNPDSYIIVDQYQNRKNHEGYLVNYNEMLRVYQQCIIEGVNYMCIYRNVVIEHKLSQYIKATVLSRILSIILLILFPSIFSIINSMNTLPTIGKVALLGLQSILMFGSQYLLSHFLRKEKHINLPLNTEVYYSKTLSFSTIVTNTFLFQHILGFIVASVFLVLVILEVAAGLPFWISAFHLNLTTYMLFELMQIVFVMWIRKYLFSPEVLQVV